MKNVYFCFTVLLLALFSCTKTTTTNLCTNFNNNFPVNHNDLITDTSGTNDNGSVFVPSAFTPNYDGLNDFFYPLGKNISLVQSMIIFNHAGDTVIQLSNFNPNDASKGWNGKSAMKDTTAEYYYKIQTTTTKGNHIGIYGNVYMLACIPSCLKIDTLRFNNQYDGDGFNPGLPNGEQLPACN